MYLLALLPDAPSRERKQHIGRDVSAISLGLPITAGVIGTSVRPQRPCPRTPTTSSISAKGKSDDSLRRNPRARLVRGHGQLATRLLVPVWPGPRQGTDFLIGRVRCPSVWVGALASRFGSSTAPADGFYGGGVKRAVTRAKRTATSTAFNPRTPDAAFTPVRNGRTGAPMSGATFLDGI